MVKLLKKDIVKAKDQRVTITCISTKNKELKEEMGEFLDEYLRIKIIMNFPMPYIIIDHREALVWSQDLLTREIDDDSIVAQLIEGREWVSTLADHFFLSHWNIQRKLCR